MQQATFWCQALIIPLHARIKHLEGHHTPCFLPLLQRRKMKIAHTRGLPDLRGLSTMQILLCSVLCQPISY